MANKLYKPLLIDSIKALEDLEEHRFIGFDGNYCGLGEKAYGVSEVSTKQDQQAPVAIFGILLVEASETIAVGDAVTSDADGKAINVEDTSIVNGYSLDDASAGELIRIVKC